MVRPSGVHTSVVKKSLPAPSAPYCISNLSSFFGETSGLPVPLLFVSESRIVLGPTVESAANVQFVLERLLLERQPYGALVHNPSAATRPL